MFVAYFQDNLKHFVRESPPNPLRGVEFTSNLDDARTFDTEAEALAYVAARGEPRPVSVLELP
jgi:hypothetical protein